MEALVAALVVVAVAAFAVHRTVRVVPQATAGVVERFGRYHRTLGPGLNLVVPFIDRIKDMVDLREQVVAFPPQAVVTSDNLVVSVDTAVSFEVADARAATYEIANFLVAVEQLTATTLRDVVGGMDVDRVLASREEIGAELRQALDDATGAWGLRVGRVELKAIDPPVSVQESMERHARADRDRRAALLAAEGEKQAAVLAAEGRRQAAVLAARGEAEATVLRARADAEARATRARGEADAIVMLLRAVREGGPDLEPLARECLRALPELAKGDAGKLWIVPPDLRRVLERLTDLLPDKDGPPDLLDPPDLLGPLGKDEPSDPLDFSDLLGDGSSDLLGKDGPLDSLDFSAPLDKDGYSDPSPPSVKDGPSVGKESPLKEGSPAKDTPVKDTPATG
ncbi:SPFH domain-containing protein [Streptosporangium sp. NBC_01495]|uniref:SPFH domain-containing protein n=1 Tax=Streptosporangium sp. NBC_01495 TaxID=2903899 RepID=UPI002E36C4BF|nr:SPFH domain-containing protein [Streptosporangium sp. NBC_01495]